MTTKLTILAVVARPKSLQIKTNDSVGTYFAKLDSGLKADMEIEAEVKNSPWDGKDCWWINKYKVVGNLSSTSQRPQGSTEWLKGASNTVNAAIAAGLIKEPMDIKAWALAWKEVVES